MSTKPLRIAMKDLCRITGNESLFTYLTKLSEVEIDCSQFYLAKLQLVPDSMNKHRLVAIVDYWTQLILDPIEELIKVALRVNFPADHMSNHAIGASIVKEKSTSKS